MSPEQQPHAFLSYTHADNELDGSKISAFRKHLTNHFQLITGRKLIIFQDIDGIAWGQHWPEILDKALDQSTFLIPILTPSFFMSDYCRDELRKFLEHEAELGRRDLVLPIYWVECDDLENAELREQDDSYSI